MRRRLLSLLVLIAVALVAPVSPAAAQNDPISGLFRFMFGGPKQAPQQSPQVNSPNAPQTAKPKRTEATEPKVVEQPKNADAQAVLVIGDEQADGLATGLQVAFSDMPSILVVNKSRSETGLVRDQTYEWSGKLGGLLAERKYDFIVVMLGENDRVTFPVAATGGKSEEVRSEKWEALYKEKVRKLAATLQASGKPFFWVGLPPLERPSLSAFASYLNGLTKPLVEQAGGVSIDSWNGFVDEEGHFAYQGPDIDGQQKRLRSYDGMHFTRAGQRKLAFFVETEIRKLMRGESIKPEVAAPEVLTSQPKAQEAMLAAPPPLPPAPWSKVGPVIPMSGEAETETELAGGPQSRNPARPTGLADTLPGGFPITETLYRRLIEGEPIAAPRGRADDFTWRR